MLPSASSPPLLFDFDDLGPTGLASERIKKGLPFRKASISGLLALYLVGAAVLNELSSCLLRTRSELITTTITRCGLIC